MTLPWSSVRSMSACVLVGAAMAALLITLVALGLRSRRRRRQRRRRSHTARDRGRWGREAHGA